MLKRLMVVSFAVLLLADYSFGQNAQPANANQNTANAQYVRGRVVRVDPAKNVVIVRSGEGDQAREQEYSVGDTTQYWGTDRQQVNDGLRYKGFRENADVWYRVGTGNNARSISEMRFYDPAVRERNK